MNQINSFNTENNIKQQREKLLELNQDLLFWVYSLIENDEFKQTIKLELYSHILTCYPDQLQNLKWLWENHEITILDLNSLRKWEINVLHGKNVAIFKPVLLSNGVIDYVTGNNGKKHMITTLRDGWVIDGLQRTTTAGRNIWSDLYKEALREHIEECPFLWKNSAGEYVLATVSKSPEDLEILIQAIHHFISQKHTLNKNNHADWVFIKAFERNFPWIKYEELWDILKEIVKNNRFMSYYLTEWEMDDMDADMHHIQISQDGKAQSEGKFFTYFDKKNNTFEYRKIQEITWFEEWFIPLSKRPGRLFLESKNQYPKIPRIEQAHITSKLVPTIQYVSEKVHFLVNKQSHILISWIVTSKEKELEDVFHRIHSDIEKAPGKTIVFDIDWVLIEAGLEVWTKSHLSLEEYAHNHQEQIMRVRKRLKQLTLDGYEIIICTGRWDDFATKVGEIILFGNYDTIISEWWVIIKRKNEKPKVSEWLEENSKYINLIKETLIRYVKSNDGDFEEWKEYVLSFNPPKDMKIMAFKEKLIRFFKNTFPWYERFIMITNSQTAVDILPLWTDKIIALNQVIWEKYMIYFGDSNNDIPALKESQLWIIPANAQNDFKEKVRNFWNITFTTQSKEIWWVLEWLKFINNI